MSRKRAITLIVILSFILSGLLFINYNMTRPTKLNKIIASKSGAPADSAFDDPEFYDCIHMRYNNEFKFNDPIPYNTKLSDEQLSTITELSCDHHNIKSIKGINKLTNLTKLNVSYNYLTTLDVSKNTSLTELYADNNSLTTLDVSKNTSLTKLYINNNEITELDVTKNTALTSLDVGNHDLEYANENKLTELDVSNNTALTYLAAKDTKLTILDVSNNTALTYLDACSNNITTLDVSNNTALTYLNISGNKLTELDVTKNTALTSLDVGSHRQENENKLTELDVSNNTNLTNLDVSANKLTELDVSKNTALTDLNVSVNSLTELDVSNNTNLTKLNVGYNSLNTLDVSKNTNLTYLNAAWNVLRTIDVSKNTNLTELNLDTSFLDTLDVSNNTNLTDLDVSANKLTELDVSKNIALTDLNVSVNSLTELDVSKNTNLTYLNVDENNLTTLNVSNTRLSSLRLTRVSNLTKLNANNSSLESIKGLNTLTKLTELDLSNNKISSLNVSNLTNLKTLKISNYSKGYDAVLKTITLPSKNVKTGEYLLEKLSIGNNLLTGKLNLTDYTKLTNLYVYGSKITEIVLPKTGTLKTISTAGSQIKTLDLSYTPGLTTITIDSKVLETLNLSNITELNKDSLTTIVKSVPNIKSLSLGNNKSLTGISLLNYEQNSQLERIVVHTSSKDENDNLTWITINNYPKLKTMTLGNLRKLKGLGLSNNALTLISNLNTKGYLPSITNINLNKNSFKSLDVSNLTSLQTLKVNQQRDENKNKCFSSITLPKSNNLYQLEVSDNNLKTIDLSTLPGLKQIDLTFNQYDLGTKIVKSGESFDITEALDSIKVNTNSIIKKKYNCAYLNDELVNNSKITLTEPGTYKYEVNFDIYGETGGGVSGIYTVKVSDIDLDIKTDYKISEENKYIYTGLETDTKKIINQITLSDGYEKEIKDNKLIIKKNNNKVREYTIINIIESPSNEKNYNKYLSKDYIYTKISEFNKDNVRTNIENQEGITKEVVNTGDVYEFTISYKGEELKTYKILTIINNKKEKYEIGKYLYVTGEYNEGEIEVTNGTVEEENNNLKIIYNDEEVDNIPELKINFGELSVSKDKIVLKEGITYEEFMKNITLINLTAKLYKGETLVTSGNIEEGMILKVSNQEGEIKVYTITKEYVDINELEIDENGYVSKYELGTTYQDIQNDIMTSGSVKFIDNTEKELQNSDIIRTGSKVVIRTGEETQEYIIVVYGDSDGDGRITINDVTKAANYIFTTEKNCYTEASDITRDGITAINDVKEIANLIFTSGLKIGGK
mgnify:CR=1 FL=1